MKQNNNEFKLSEEEKMNIFNIGGIKLPEGSTLAIWFLVITILMIAGLSYGIWSIIDRVLDAKLPSTEMNAQADFNNLLKEKKELEAENEALKDSLIKVTTPTVEEIKQANDSIIYQEYKPFINK